MDTVTDNKKVNFPITKLTIGIAALGVAGGVFFGGFLSSQGASEAESPSEQSFVVSETLKNQITAPLDENKQAGAQTNVQILTTDGEEVKWTPGSPIPEGYIAIGNSIVNKEALTFNPDGTMSWDSGFPVPAGYVVVDGLLYPEEVSPEAMENKVPKPKPTAEQTLKTETGKAEIKPAPAQNEPIEEPTNSGKQDASDHKGPPLGSPDCPATREEDPSLYDECRAGFVAPTIEWAGYHSCEKTSDGNVRIFGKVSLAGGNYNSNYYGWHTRVVDGFAIVNSYNSSAPYFVSWGAQAWFGSMSEKAAGRIAIVYGTGVNKIDESLLDPSCLP